MMRKTLFLVAFIAVNEIIFAQTNTGSIGVNTKDPSATLDIVSKGIDATTKALEINNSTATPEMVTVLNNGNMGLGIANPVDHLHLRYGSIRIDDDDDTSDNGIKFSAAGGIYHRLGSNLGISGTGKYISMNSNSNGVALETSNGDPSKNGLLMLRNGTGNVGIGTANPDSKLTVNGSSTRFEYNNGSESNNMHFVNDGSRNEIYFSTTSDPVSGGQWSIKSANGQFQVLDRPGSGAAALTITHGTGTDSGNIGIGTDTPNTKLDIVAPTPAGGFRLADGSQADQKVLTSDANGNAKWAYPKDTQYLELSPTYSGYDITITKGINNHTIVPGLEGFTPTSTGKYMIVYHCFLRGDSTSSQKAVYFIIKKNGSIIKNPETYGYVVGDSYLAQTVTVIIDVNAGDNIAFEFGDGQPLPQTLTFVDPNSNAQFQGRNKVEVAYMGR
ncbi:hypothetical protein [Chryseobacterium limigenitum]|uniref:C1q domain-containing protein n=1 Tax=Chryseobacterium limigenitum TaxID=1612149 RepID=A0A1K2IXP1_9FLAO|nr:hypothetical protein [Chryseobacterium limigenitum]SFZ96960.1 hypothetical protein SAMN05216324_13119 [Chryseobacterium limigenitum]